jgi:hypothetical protein
MRMWSFGVAAGAKMRRSYGGQPSVAEVSAIRIVLACRPLSSAVVIPQGCEYAVRLMLLFAQEPTFEV